MNWKLLKDGLCPQCAKKLNMGLLDFVYKCTSCDFSIGREKFENIAFGPPRLKHSDFEDNASALNNLGHEVVTEDFSDSPFKT